MALLLIVELYLSTESTDSLGNSFCFQYGDSIVEGNPATQVNISFDMAYSINDSMIDVAISVSSGATIDVPCSKKILESEESARYILYPNPIKNTLFIKSNDGNFLKTITIYNVYGKYIRSIIIPSNKYNSASLIDVDMKELNKGIYSFDLAGEKVREMVKVLKY